MLVVVGGPFMIGPFSWLSLSGSFQITPPNSASVANTMAFLIMLHYTCAGPFLAGIDFIGVLDFFPRKKYPPAPFRASGSDM